MLLIFAIFDHVTQNNNPMNLTRCLATIIAVVLYTTPSLIIAQQIQILEGEREVMNSTNKLNKVFGHDKENYYVIKYSGTQYFFEKLDNNLNSVLEEPVKLFKGFSTYKLEAIYHFYNEIYIFVSIARVTNITLFYVKIDKQTFQPLTNLIEISTVKNVKGSMADFHFALSKQETKLMVMCRTKVVLSGAQFNEFYVFGENFELVWKRKDSYQYKGQGPRDNAYLVDEKGNVSILGLLKRESLISLLREKRNEYAIYRYTNNGNEFFEYPVTLNENYIRGIKIIAGENGDLICAGLWSELFRSGIKGTFFFKIDESTGQIFDHILNSFDEAIMAELSSGKEPMINAEELISYVITDIVLREQGRSIVIAEQVFHQNYNTYNNLIVTSLESNGQVYWTRVIAKKQNFSFNTIAPTGIDLLNYREFIRETGLMDPSSYNLCSYALMAPLDRSGIVLFYNDDIRNMTGTDKVNSFSNPKKSYLLAVAIDAFGNLSKTPLIPWKKKALHPVPLRYYDTLGETIVVPAFRMRHISYYKLSADVIP